MVAFSSDEQQLGVSLNPIEGFALRQWAVKLQEVDVTVKWEGLFPSMIKIFTTMASQG